MPSIKSLLMSRKSSPPPEKEGQEADQWSPRRRCGSSSSGLRRLNISGTGSITPPSDDESILEITLVPNTAPTPPPAPVFTTLLSVHFSPTLPTFGDVFLSPPLDDDTKQVSAGPHSGSDGPSDPPVPPQMDSLNPFTPPTKSTATFPSPLRFHSPTDSVASMASWQSDDSGVGWKEISGNFPLTPSREYFASLHASNTSGDSTATPGADFVHQTTPSSIPFPMIDATAYSPPISPRGSSLGLTPHRASLILPPCLPTISEGGSSTLTPGALLESPYRPVTPTPDSPRFEFDATSEEEEEDDAVFSAMEAEANMHSSSGWYSGSASSFDDSSDCSSEWSCDEDEESWDAVIAPAKVHVFQQAPPVCSTPMTGLVIPTKLGTISEEDEEEEEEEAHEAVTPVDICAPLPNMVTVKMEAAAPALKEALLLGRKLQLAEGLDGQRTPGHRTPASRSRAGSFSSSATPRAGSPCGHDKENEEPLGSPFEGWRATFQLGEGHWDD